MAPECQHEGRRQQAAAICSVTRMSTMGMAIAHQLCCHLPASETVDSNVFALLCAFCDMY